MALSKKPSNGEPHSESTEDSDARRKNSKPHLTRRGLFTAGGVALVGGAGGFALAKATAATPETKIIYEAADPSAKVTVPFYGAHQAGVDTPAQVYTKFIGLNAVDKSRETFEAIGRIVTDDAARLTQGEPALGDTEPEVAANPSRLTITFGVGRGYVKELGIEPPSFFPEIPGFSTDALDPAWGQTDLVLQIGSDDPLTLAHAQRMLIKDLSTLTNVEWIQEGFISPTPGTDNGKSSRNLMGQVDGTVNPTPDQFNEVVWVEDDSWAQGGTVLILRRIRMLMDEWDQLDRSAKEIAVGRTLDSGAPLGGAAEGDLVDFDALDADGLPLIPRDAHIRVAHANSPAEMILRRPYSYDAGVSGGVSDMGLLFAAYTNNPNLSFIPMQTRLAESDAMNRWLTTIGSAAYVIVPGINEGEFLGEKVLRG